MDFFQGQWTLETQRQEILRRPPPKHARGQEPVFVEDDAPTPTRDVQVVKAGDLSSWVATRAQNIALTREVRDTKKALSVVQAETAVEVAKNSKLAAVNRATSSTVRRAVEGEQL